MHGVITELFKTLNRSDVGASVARYNNPAKNTSHFSSKSTALWNMLQQIFVLFKDGFPRKKKRYGLSGKH